MTSSSAEIRAGMEQHISRLFDEIYPEELERYTSLHMTRRTELPYLQGVEVVHQEIPMPNRSGRPSGVYVLTMIDRRVSPPRVYAFSEGSQLGALACECLDESIATKTAARSAEVWHGVKTSIGSQIATFMLTSLDPEAHPIPSTNVNP